MFRNKVCGHEYMFKSHTIRVVRGIRQEYLFPFFFGTPVYGSIYEYENTKLSNRMLKIYTQYFSLFRSFAFEFTSVLTYTNNITDMKSMFNFGLHLIRR